MCWWDVKPYSINQSINQSIFHYSLFVIELYTKYKWLQLSDKVQCGPHKLNNLF